MSHDPLLRLSSAGLYCPKGGFYIDPWSPVACAVITHPHGDHAVKGSRQYLASQSSRQILQHRMGPRARIQAQRFGESVDIKGVRVTLHPAGHILGSAQVRVEYCGEVWVVSGDYKVAADVTCEPFEAVRCDTFITESTFGHPRFHWEPQADAMAAVHEWWRSNQQSERASLIYAYSLGKAQRLLAALDSSVGPIYAHPVIEEMNALYRASGIQLPETRCPEGEAFKSDWSRSLIVLPPAMRSNPTFAFHGHYETAFVSGWMTLPEEPRRRGVDHGFALSDHADYDELLSAVTATGARRVLVTHGYIDDFVMTLKTRGYEAESLRTPRCKLPPSVV